MATKKGFAKSTVKGNRLTFWVILLVVALLGVLTAKGWQTPFKDPEGNRIVLNGVPSIRYGIDIRGGVEAVFAPKDLDRNPTATEWDAATQVLNFRLDQLQILDREVIPSPQAGRIIVRFPWRSDETDFNPEKALQELGEMALLTFQDEKGQTLVDGSMVKNAAAVYDEQTKSPVVALEFNETGKEAFKKATEDNLNKLLKILLDDKVLSTPRVQVVIPEGRATITGQFTSQEALDLAGKINAGSLPFAMTAISSSTISPSLGQNSLEVMARAGLISFIIICVLMIVRYRLPGFVGCISLIAQVIGILLAISIPQQTLTLQGLAGIILSIGMGVDANIILAERIKEESYRSSSLPTILHNGFTKAFSSVMDGNVTVAIAAITLMIFGSGTVLSFGYSLLWGVIFNGLTGVWMSRQLISSLSAYPFLQKLGLYGRSSKEPKERVLAVNSHRKVLIGLSVVLVVAGIVASLVTGIHLSIQFKGGSVVTYAYDGEINPDEAEGILSQAMGMTVNCLNSKALSDESTKLQVSVAGNEALTPEELDLMTQTLRKTYPDAKVEISSSDLVNPSVGREMLRNGLLALVIASVLIVAYVWFSFRSMTGPSAGVMALVALLHDIILSTISFVLIGAEINETLIAVVLTILGFSINNTIVIYDRIRELLPKYKNELSLEEIVDRAISASVTRTVGTSVAIFIAILTALIFAILYGLPSIVEFAVPILVGTVCGTYSSLFLSSPLWTLWKNRHQKANS